MSPWVWHISYRPPYRTNIPILSTKYFSKPTSGRTGCVAPHSPSPSSNLKWNSELTNWDWVWDCWLCGPNHTLNIMTKTTCTVKAARNHSSGGEAIGENEPTTKPEPVNYTLTQSFSHASYGISHTPSSPIAPHVPNIGVSPTAAALRPTLSRLVLVWWMVLALWATSMLYEPKSLRWMV